MKKYDVVINVDVLKRELSALQQQNPERTKWNLDLLLNNLTTETFQTLLSNNDCVLSVDSKEKAVLFEWKEVPFEHENLPIYWLKDSLNWSSHYAQVFKAIEHAKNLWLFDKVFRIIKKSNLS